MNMQHFKYYFFVLITLLACQSKIDSRNAEPLLTILTPDMQMNFMVDNTIHYKNTSAYITEVPNHILSQSEIVKRDGFIHSLAGNERQESYINMDNCFESHRYTISINSGAVNKRIEILGHRAPAKYYELILWATSLNRTR